MLALTPADSDSAILDPWMGDASGGLSPQYWPASYLSIFRGG